MMYNKVAKRVKPAFVIYKITNLLDGRYYIGKHKTMNPNDSYMGSSPFLTEDIKRLGRHNFKKTILHIYEKESTMIRKEKQLVTMEMIQDPKTYNNRMGG